MERADTDPEVNWDYAKSLGRAAAGAAIFSLPLMMTMEMWWLGFYMDRSHLAQFMLVNFMILVGLSRVSGFEPTTSLVDDLLDAFSAFGVAAIMAAVVLALFGIITVGMPHSEVVGKIAIQAVPGSFGAMLASKQLGVKSERSEEEYRKTYLGQLFLMLAGALFLAFNVAPTEEMLTIAFRMSAWHSIALLFLSIMLLHALVYTVGFRGTEQPAGANGFLTTFFRFSIVGYAIAVLASLYILWTFGRTDGASLPQIASMVAVLGFPGAIGAAIARLVI